MSRKGIKSLFRANKNRKLVSVKAEVFFYKGAAAGENPMAVSFKFDSSKVNRVSVASDGESILVSDQPLRTYDMSDCGYVDVLDISSRESINDKINSKLINVCIFHSGFSKKIIGIKLCFQNDQSLSLICLGDELFIYGEVPLQIIKDEELDTEELF